MVKKRTNSQADSWIKVVTVMTVVGLLALTTLGFYCLMQRMSNPCMPCDQTQMGMLHGQKKSAFVRPWSLNVPSICPAPCDSLKRQVELPLEVVRNKPGYLRPASRRSYIRDRVDRLEKNIELLQESQTQEEAIKQMERRLKKLQKLCKEF